MSDMTATLVHQRERIAEIARVASRYGFADWAARIGAGSGPHLLELVTGHLADPALASMSEGERVRGVLVELGTTWMKFGQMLSLRPDLVGVEVATELEKLQAEVPADPPGVAVATVEAELGAPVAELYATFEPEPFASGSVAQVHRATLLDGTAVAVKVLHDGADTKVRSDLELMAALAQQAELADPELARYRPSVLVAEFADMMRSAIDLGQELANLQLFGDNFAAETDVVIPVGYPERSSRRVVTMSLLSGSQFSDRETIEATGWDVDALVNRAADVYFEMIFRDGVYHADPHPGNFLLPDGEHLAILDFGDIGRISRIRQRQLADLVIAVGTRDIDAMTEVVLEMTSPPAGIDEAGLRDDIEDWLNRYLLVGVGHLDIAAIATSGSAMMRRHQLALPADLALLIRVLVRLQGLGQAVGTEVRVTELLEPYVKKMMAQRLNPARMARTVVHTVRDWEHLIQSFPEEIHAVLEQIRTGTVGVDFRIHDSDGATDRLVDGIMAASSLLASSQLLSRRTGPTIAGISVPGIAAVAVSAATWRRLLVKRQGHRTMAQRARHFSSAGRS